MKEYVISVDLGGTNVRVGLISSDLEIIKVNREPSIKKDKITGRSRPQRKEFEKWNSASKSVKSASATAQWIFLKGSTACRTA